MKKPYISSSRTGVTVLEVVKVRVSSGSVKTDVDTEAVTFLQWAGFLSIKPGQQLDRHVYGMSPKNETTTFLLEHEVPPHLNSGTFRLIRIMQGNRTELDRGYTVFVEKSPDDVGEVSVVGVGDTIKDWEVTCCIANDDVRKLNESLVPQTATISQGKNSRNRGSFWLNKHPNNQSVGQSTILHTPPVPPVVSRSEESREVELNEKDGSVKPKATVGHRRFIIPYHGSNGK